MEQKPYRTSMVQHHRWSALHSDIINNIISHLDPLCDTVITISTTSFSIEQDYKLYDHKPTYNIYEYWTILDNLFTLFAPPDIDKFCLDIHAYHYDEPRCWPIIDTWARKLRSCNVQHMEVASFGGFHQFDENRLYLPNVFRMHSLLTLDLLFDSDPVGYWRLPNSIVLPNLKKLCFKKFDYEYLGRLLSCCPSLEDLSLSIDIPQESVVLITSKSLKRLDIQLEGNSIRDVIVDTPILEEFNYGSNSILSMQMLDSTSNVKTLTINTASPIRFINWPTTLPELIHLELSTSFVIFQEIIEQQMMHCSNLEVLVLRNLFHYKEMIWNQEAEFMLVQQVKRIELYTDFNGFSKNALNLVTMLLRSAKVLEKLVLYAPVHCCPSIDKLVKSQFCQTLFAQILIEDGHYSSQDEDDYSSQDEDD